MIDRLEGIKGLLQKDVRINRIDIGWLIEQAQKAEQQQELIDSQARVLEDFLSDLEDVRVRLVDIREGVRIADTTGSLEEKNECLDNAIRGLSYLIDHKLDVMEEGKP